MNRPSFLDFRVQLAAYAQSVGSPLGICIGNIPSLTGLVNVATERLINDPMAPEEGWWGGWARYVFNVDPVNNPFIVAPRGVARIILLDVNTCPVKLQNGFYEFLDYGPGLQPKPCKQPVCNGFTQTYDRETVPTLGVLLSTPQIIRVFPTDPRDSGKTVIIQGTDQNGQTITSTDPVTNQTILGEIVTLALPFVDTVNQFLAAPNKPGITGITKDGTFGSVTFFQADPTSGASSALSTMEPSETNAAYRKYFVNNLPCAPQCSTSPTVGSQVQAMAKLEYIPIASDSDYLGILSVPALISECESLRFGTMDSLKAQQMSVSKHSQALQLLFGQLQHVLGNERPAISVNLFGPRSHLRMQPI